MNEKGSILPLVSGYLALVLMIVFGASSVISAHVIALRIQGVADAAVLFGHDQANLNSMPDAMQLESAVESFLREALSAQELSITKTITKALKAESSLVLCAKWQDPLARLQFAPIEICRAASAKSFRVF
jgi:hypothetical protein